MFSEWHTQIAGQIDRRLVAMEVVEKINKNFEYEFQG
jgi:hypothetical protein